jgi:hypothetical protein
MQGRNRRIAVSFSCLSLLAVLSSLPATAQPPILAGIDILETSTTGGTVVSFASNPIPAGFFCAGSAAYTGSVNLKGVPLATTPAGAAGTADTILERPSSASFVSGIASVGAVVRAMRMTSTAPIAISCPGSGTTQWNVNSCLCGSQPTNILQVKVTGSCGANCGTFNGVLKLQACLRFTRVGTGVTVGPIAQVVQLNVNNTPWCSSSGTGSFPVASAFRVDTNCDGSPDLPVLPTSNFFPGWKCSTLTSGQTCLQQYAALTRCHPNFTNPGSHEHCVNPVCRNQTTP